MATTCTATRRTRCVIDRHRVAVYVCLSAAAWSSACSLQTARWRILCSTWRTSRVKCEWGGTHSHDAGRRR
jgi:hypothetical protein